MVTCYQFKDTNVLQHGQSVNKWYMDLIEDRQFEWKFPSWIDEVLKEQVYDPTIMRWYQVYHDCGKPLCRIADANGKQHFPEHAENSFIVWQKCADNSEASKIIGNLIRSDMDCHTIKGESILDFIKREEAPALILTALCEIHSNAQMFGGIDSISFKIKWKQIDKIGKKFIDYHNHKG